VVEHIYIGRRVMNGTDRLEKFFEMYTKMTKARPGLGLLPPLAARVTSEVRPLWWHWGIGSWVDRGGGM